MEFFKKRSTAWTIFVLTVIFTFFIGQRGRTVSKVEILPSGVYVQDGPDLLSDATEEYITQMNNGLNSQVAAEIQVAILDTTNGKDMYDVCYDLAMETNLSPNCCVFVVAVDDINAYILQGEEIMYYFSDGELSDILNSNFTVSDFENRDINFAVRSTFDDLIGLYEGYYNITVVGRTDIEKVNNSGMGDEATAIIRLLIFILLIILVVYITTRPGRRRTVFVPTGRTTTGGYYPPRGSYRTPPPYSGGSSSRNTTSRSGGFGSSSRGGSFSSSSRSSSSRSGGFSSGSRSSSSRGGSFSSSSRSSSSRSGGFGGGSRGGSFGGGSRGGGFRK